MAQARSHHPLGEGRQRIDFIPAALRVRKVGFEDGSSDAFASLQSFVAARAARHANLSARAAAAHTQTFPVSTAYGKDGKLSGSSGG